MILTTLVALAFSFPVNVKLLCKEIHAKIPQLGQSRLIISSVLRPAHTKLHMKCTQQLLCIVFHD